MLLFVRSAIFFASPWQPMQATWLVFDFGGFSLWQVSQVCPRAMCRRARYSLSPAARAVPPSWPHGEAATARAAKIAAMRPRMI